MAVILPPCVYRARSKDIITNVQRLQPFKHRACRILFHYDFMDALAVGRKLHHRAIGADNRTDNAVVQHHLRSVLGKASSCGSKHEPGSLRLMDHLKVVGRNGSVRAEQGAVKIRGN